MLLVCPRCGALLRGDSTSWRCSEKHVFPIRNGVVDLANGGHVDSTAHWFDSPIGSVYDFGVQHPAVAIPVARAVWGSALSQMYRLMDRGTVGPPGQVVLDVPVGGAPVLRRATALHGTYLGVDLSIGMLERAAKVAAMKSFEDVTLIRADATRLPIADGGIDRILCFNGLHVIPDKQAVIAEFARVLRPGGTLWGSVLARPASALAGVIRPWTSRPFWYFHPADAAELEAMARDYGFEQWNQHRLGAAMITFEARR